MVERLLCLRCKHEGLRSNVGRAVTPHMVGCSHNASVPMADDRRVGRTLRSAGSAIQVGTALEQETSSTDDGR